MEGHINESLGYSMINFTDGNTSNFTVQTNKLNDLNMAQFRIKLPAFLYTIALMVVGTPGNMLVLYVYFFKWRKSTSRMFILFLTSLDLINCVTTLPMEIYIMRFSIVIDIPWLCKISRFSTYTMNSSSAAILVAIAVDRFRRICRPHGPQFNATNSKYICIGCILVALGLYSWPSLLFYGTRTIQINGISGKSCLLENQYDNSLYPNLYFAFHIISTVIVFSVLSILYYFVGLQVCRHRKMRLRRKAGNERVRSLIQQEQGSIAKEETLLQDSDSAELAKNQNHVKANSTDPSQTNCIELLTVPVDPKAEISTSTFESSINTSVNTTFLATEPTRTTDASDKRRKRSNQKAFSKRNGCLRDSLNMSNGSYCINIKIRIGRSTLMLFLITLAYIVSFLPFCVIAVLRQTESSFIVELNEFGFAMYQLCLRSYLLSCAINPIIYSFCNAQFRAFCFDTFRRKQV
ncbi:neuropeptide Y receptor type 5-like [Dreissena polymorpha]|uniref:G-protein coupled receptors family 1 profile domain-containing protein n=1 Tax=Dreissena polymorpha TaxID=45954 RepID=A0A9D4MC45_DREPO|nr:neuropeptide Y receptor type 5-like [Dreissena polymorpha]KAH3874837.1 hypothetical protein DPMN_038090 [Dreissena polymorpha]